MKISKFSLDRVHSGTSKTLMTAPFLPGDLKAPFGSAWGYLEKGISMEPHSHSYAEVYMIVKGNGTIVVEGEEATVEAGEVIDIPCNDSHYMKNSSEEPLLILAMWWEPVS